MRQSGTTCLRRAVSVTALWVTALWGTALWGTALAAAVVVVGCGDGGPRRYQLSGQVTFDGQPVPSGMIRFEADASRGNRGPVGHAAIKDGRYTTVSEGSKGALKGPLIAFISGGPAPDPTVEFPVMWFNEYSQAVTLDPKQSVTVMNFDVPRSVPAPK